MVHGIHLIHIFYKTIQCQLMSLSYMFSTCWEKLCVSFLWNNPYTYHNNVNNDNKKKSSETLVLCYRKDQMN